MTGWTLAQQRRYRLLVAEWQQATGLGDDERRDIMRRVCGVRSTTGLDRQQMARLIREMELLCRRLGVGTRRPARRRDAAARRGDHTPRQWGMIMGLVADLGWAGEPARLDGFIRRTLRGWQGGVEGLSRGNASLVIAGLLELRGDQQRGTAAVERHERPAAPTFRPRVISGGLPPRNS